MTHMATFFPSNFTDICPAWCSLKYWCILEHSLCFLWSADGSMRASAEPRQKSFYWDPRTSLAPSWSDTVRLAKVSQYGWAHKPHTYTLILCTIGIKVNCFPTNGLRFNMQIIHQWQLKYLRCEISIIIIIIIVLLLFSNTYRLLFTVCGARAWLGPRSQALPDPSLTQRLVLCVHHSHLSLPHTAGRPLLRWIMVLVGSSV